MPRYEYKCSTCGEVFERTKRMSESSDPDTCLCGGSGERIISRIAPQHDKMVRMGDPRLLDD
jgi:putative FmdB family regulatory protein